MSREKVEKGAQGIKGTVSKSGNCEQAMSMDPLTEAQKGYHSCYIKRGRNHLNTEILLHSQYNSINQTHITGNGWTNISYTVYKECGASSMYICPSPNPIINGINICPHPYCNLIQ